MNLRDLQYVMAVASYKNFSAAAQACHVSQPTLSNQIRKLEETFGVTIFERTNKRVMITPVGAQLVTHAEAILREAEAMKAVAKHAHDPFSGTFTLGAFPTLSAYFFPEVLRQVRRALPKLHLRLVEEKTDRLLEQLIAGELDAALLALPIMDEKLQADPLFDDAFMLAVPKQHAFAKRKKISHAALEGEAILLLDEGHCLRNQALDVCALDGAGEAENVRATSLETLRQMVRAGNGITFMPEIAAHKTPGVVYVPFEKPAPKRSIALVYRKTTTRRPVTNLMRELFAK